MDGTEGRWGLLEQIVLIPSEVWEAGLEAVNAEIGRIEIELGRSDPTDIRSAAESLSKPSKQVVGVIREAMHRNRAELPPTYDAIESLILLEIERLQNWNYRDEDDKQEALRQIGIYLTLHGAVTAMRRALPATGDATDEQAEKTIGLMELYRSKLRELPGARVDEVVDGVWEGTKGAAQFGLIGGSAYLASLLAMPPMIGVTVGALCFAPKRAGDIIKHAKDALVGKTP